MARLHEHQGKSLLRRYGIDVPRGQAVSDARAAVAAAEAIGGPVVLKVQAWITGRAARGGIVFAAGPDEVADKIVALLGMNFGRFPVREVLVEETLALTHQMFVSLSIDDATQAPVLLLDPHGGSGIEDRAAGVARLPVDVRDGIDAEAVREVLAASPLPRERHDGVVSAVEAVVRLAREQDARSVEINPLAVTADGRIVAADCRITIDDYAVYRHGDLGIEIARELDHPPTALELAAYEVEQADHRGTFYFAQLPVDDGDASRGLVAFHGAGGGGSMMSMDAVSSAGFTLANFCDTSGNPSAAKVYRAARIILAQDGLVGYFGSGSGVASQEQYHSAYGLAKAFLEMNLSIPAVIRLGGNSEDRAVEILGDACRALPAVVEGYRKDDTPAFCAERFAGLVEEAGGSTHAATRNVPEYVGHAGAYSFPITGGHVWIDHEACDELTSRQVVGHCAGLLEPGDDGRPVLAVSEKEIAGNDSELIACEIECHRAGSPVLFVDLDMPDQFTETPHA